MAMTMTTNTPGNNGGERVEKVETCPDVTGIGVAILGVTATPKRPGTPGMEPCAWTAVEDYAAVVHDRTGIRAGRLLLAHRGADAVAVRIAELPGSVSAVFVVGMSPSQSACVQLKAASLEGPVVVSEFDVIAAALAAAAINTLRRHNVAPRHGRIVVTNPEVLPRLGPLLLMAGVATLTIWNEREAGEHTLPAVMADHDLLIDLAGTAPGTAAPDRTLMLPRKPFDYGALVLPGLLSAVCRHHAASLTIGVLAACARAVAAIARPSRILPALTEPLLVPTVTSQVARVLGQHRPPRCAYRHPSAGPQPIARHRNPGGQPS